MSATTPDSAQPPIVVMGIEVEGMENAVLVRKVIATSVLFVCLIIFNNVMSMAEDAGQQANKILGLVMALMVPACGYFVRVRCPREMC